jgi:cytochrome c5
VNRSGFYRVVSPMSTARRNRLLFVATTLVVQATMLVILLCRHALGQNPSYEPDYKWHAPAKAAMRPNPLARSPEFSAGGKKIFLRECAECHQHDGSGLVEKHSADLRSPVVQSLSDGALFWKVTDGNPRRAMPSFSRLPEKQRWQLVLFLRTLRGHQYNDSSK